MILLFFPTGIALMWLYGTWKIATKLKVTAGVLAIFSLLFIAYLSSSAETNYKQVENSVEPTSYNAEVSITDTPVPTGALATNTSYKILEQSDNGSVENYKVLVNSGDEGKAIALEVKNTCSKSCNIDVYDDKRALELQKEYDSMMGSLDTQPADLQAWKTNNYVFVADHFLGYMSFDTDEFMEYPYKDWYYRELKGQ